MISVSVDYLRKIGDETQFGVRIEGYEISAKELSALILVSLKRQEEIRRKLQERRSVGEVHSTQ